MMANRPASIAAACGCRAIAHGLTLLPISLQAGHSTHTAVH